VYNSLNFGVPQNRERVYIVGFRNKAVMDAFKWPEAPGRGEIMVQDILEPSVSSAHYYENKPLHDRIKDYVLSENIVYQYRRNYVRANAKGVSPTLMANMGTGGHNVPIVKDLNGIRRLSPRECARLQGYDDLVIPDRLSFHRIYRQIGNSVTVPVIKVVADAMVEALDKVNLANLHSIPATEKVLSFIK
jgi:DNA (cytosine-5)-methyltransferase 1